MLILTRPNKAISKDSKHKEASLHYRRTGLFVFVRAYRSDVLRPMRMKEFFMTEAQRIEHNLKVIERIRGKSATPGGRKLARAMNPRKPRFQSNRETEGEAVADVRDGL